MGKCKIQDCEKVYKWGVYCPLHKARIRRHGDPNTVKYEKHGKSHSPEWWAWKNIRRRCHVETDKDYRYYGARGIKMYAEWRESFTKFYEYIGERPNPGYTVERIDNNGDYEPGNVCWATRLEQGANQRSNHLITYKGKTQTLSQWARERDIKRATLSERILRSKWSIPKALGFE